MSDLPADYADRLNLREQIARIDRSLDEAAKFRAERAKLDAESNKLAAEAAKFRRERFLAPILAAGALGGFVAAILPVVLRSWGLR